MDRDGRIDYDGGERWGSIVMTGFTVRTADRWSLTPSVSGLISVGKGDKSTDGVKE